MNRHMYRAWDREEEEMFTPCTLNNNDMFFTGFNNGKLMCSESAYNQESRYILMQSANILDASEQMVFESDIVLVRHMLIETVPPFRAEVVWDKYRFALRNLEYEHPTLSQTPFQASLIMSPYTNLDPFGMNLEILGDKYRNPELLLVK